MVKLDDWPNLLAWILLAMVYGYNTSFDVAALLKNWAGYMPALFLL